MDCEEARDIMHGRLDGELDLAGDLAVQQHLNACAACLRRYRAYRELRDAVTSASLYRRAPARLHSRLAALPGREDTAATPYWRAATSWLRLPAVWAPAAVLVVALAAWALLRGLAPTSGEAQIAQQVLSSHLRSLMADHLADVASGDQHTVKPWFAGKLDYSPPVVDLAAHGFPLVGGRLDYLDDRPVAALVYRRRQHRINVFVWPAGRAPARGAVRLARRGYHLVGWTGGGMTYWAVSDVSASELDQLVRLIQASSG